MSNRLNQGTSEFGDFWGGSDSAYARRRLKSQQRLQDSQRAANFELVGKCAAFLRSGTGSLRNPLSGLVDECGASYGKDGRYKPTAHLAKLGADGIREAKDFAELCNVTLWEKQEYVGREELIVKLQQFAADGRSACKPALAFLASTCFMTGDGMTDKERKAVMSDTTTVAADADYLLRGIEEVENPLHLMRSADDRGKPRSVYGVTREQMLADCAGLSLRLWRHATTASSTAIIARLLLQRDGGAADYRLLLRYRDMLDIDRYDASLMDDGWPEGCAGVPDIDFDDYIEVEEL